MAESRYIAFISYSHRDRRWAEWLHAALENYRMPKRLVGRDSPLGFVPAQLKPIFRDRDELSASHDLGEKIRAALQQSRAQLVLCSPSAAASHWTNEEILTFKRLNPGRPILAAILDGEPFASGKEGQEALECFPPALRFEINPDGSLSDRPAEPIAADFRSIGDGKRLGKLKLVAGMFDLDLDELVQRDQVRRNRRLAMIAAASFAGMVLASGLAVFALSQRNEARSQRAEADGLIDYMVTDLRSQLEPLGRLDLLDGVGKRAMSYYSRQNLAQLSPSELGRRARATQLVAEVANLRGNNSEALPAFREAARTTAEMLVRNPDDPERMFNHGQSLFWVGYVAWQHGDLTEAREKFEGYADISRQLAKRDPANLDWQMELAYSLSNLGTLANDEGRFSDALPLFVRSAAIVDQVSAAEGRGTAREIEYGEGLSWVATTQRKLGQAQTSIATRQRENAIYQGVLAKDPNNADAMRAAIRTEGQLGQLLAETGQRPDAMRHFDASIAIANRLIAADPENTLQQELVYPAYCDRAVLLWAEGKADLATADLRSAARIMSNLRKRDPKNARWSGANTARVELLSALLSRPRGHAERFVDLANGWIGKLDATDPANLYPLTLAYMLQGEALGRAGRSNDASAAYRRVNELEMQAGEGADSQILGLRALAAARAGQKELEEKLRATLRQQGVTPVIDERL